MAHKFRSSRSGLENSGMSVGPVLLLDGTGDHASWPVLDHRKHSNDENLLHHHVHANGLDAEGASSESSCGQVSYLAPPPAEIPRHILAQVQRQRERSSSGDGKGTTFSDMPSAADAPQASSRPENKRHKFHWPRPASAASSAMVAGLKTGGGVRAEGKGRRTMAGMAAAGGGGEGGGVSGSEPATAKKQRRDAV